MRTNLTLSIAASIDEVFAFFDDPLNLALFQDHAASHLQRRELVEVRPDGRRQWDFHMRAGSRAWVQTVDQVVRQPPTRLLSRGWTWTTNRDERLLTVTTDRRLVVDGGRTRLDVTVEYHVEHPWRHPMASVANRLWGNGAARLELEHALHFAAEHLEGRRPFRDIVER